MEKQLKTKSEKIQRLGKQFRDNSRFAFDMKVYENLITFRNYPAVVKALFYIMIRPLDLYIKQLGNITIIYDPDTLLNKKWLKIWR